MTSRAIPAKRTSIPLHCLLKLFIHHEIVKYTREKWLEDKKPGSQLHEKWKQNFSSSKEDEMSFWQANSQVVIFLLVELSMTRTQTTSDRLPKETQHLGRKAALGIPF